MTRNIIPYKSYLKQLAAELRKNITFSEVLLWNHLKQKRMMGYDFDRQRPIDAYIVDFYSKELMLAIEIDGVSHHHEEVCKKDEVRQIRLQSLGVRFIRVSDKDVKEDIHGVLRTIEHWIIDNEERTHP